MFRLLICMTMLMSSQVWAAKKLVIYSSRKSQHIKPVLDAYEKKTGTKIELLTDKGPVLIERIKAEGNQSPADILLTVDAGNLWLADQKHVLTAVHSEKLKKNVRRELRDADNHWFGFSVRARTLFYNPKKVKKSELVSYEDLASPKWKGRLCLRTSKKVYNQSLVASLIDRHGEEKTEKIVKGWVNNLAVPVFANDTNLLKAIDSGQCQVGIANSYYFGRLQKKNPKLNVKVFWPNQKKGGVHVNVSGGGVTAASKRKEEAKKFLEWLSEGEAQGMFASLGYEFPANKKVAKDPLVAKWGSFKEDSFDLNLAGMLQSQAVKVMDRAGYK